MKFIQKKLNIFRINFKKFWKNLPKSNLPQELIEITEKFIVSDSFKYVSNYWHFININIYKKFIKIGKSRNVENIEVQHLYFNSITSIHTYSNNDLIKNTFKNVENIKINYEINLFKKHYLLDYDQSYKLNHLLVLLYENLRKLDEYKLLKSLNDETFNDPFIEVEGGGKNYTNENNLFTKLSFNN